MTPAGAPGAREDAGLARPIEQIRSEFPGLKRGEVRLDGAAGTLVPAAVIAAVGAALTDSMANLHGEFAASRRSTETLAAARSAVADLLGGRPEGVLFGPNMTTLTFHLADALAHDWAPGDEVVVTSLDHDANVRPWVHAAARVGATVRMAEFDPGTGELPVAALADVIGERTRVVALTAASNAIGTKPDVRAVTELAHAAGALTYIDGVHATAHGPIDVAALGADLYACSLYKLFGPHVGTVIASPGLLERIQPAKLVPAPETVPERFERGTPALELLAGVTAAVDWVAALSSVTGDRRTRVIAAMAAVEARLGALLDRALGGLAGLETVRVLAAPARRTSTISFVIAGQSPQVTAAALADRGIAVWAGDNYAFELMDRFGLGDGAGAVRASIVLYNHEHDVDELIAAVSEIAGG